MRLKKIFLIILLLILLLPNFCFAGNNSSWGQSALIDLQYDNLYTYVFQAPYNNGLSTEADTLKNIAENDDKVVSGSYYYFINFLGEWTTNGQIQSYDYTLFYVKKSAIENGLNISLLNNTSGFYTGSVYQVCAFDISTDSSDVIAYDNAEIFHWGDNYQLPFYSFLNSSTKVFDFYGYTNYDRDIFHTCTDNSKKYLQYGKPYIYNTNEELQNFSEVLKVVPYSIPSLTFKILQAGNEIVSADVSNFFTEENYFRIDPFNNLYGYNISWNLLPSFSLNKDTQYDFRLQYSLNGQTYNVSRFINVLKDFNSSSYVPPDNPDEPTTPDYTETIGNMGNQISGAIIESNKETQNILNDQTNAIKENTETNKNIFQRIGQIFNLLNPFSENFFAYELIRLLLEALKGFIVPSNEFLSTFFTELSDWFEERLGFLWTPFDIANEFLTRLNNGNLFVEPIIHIPNIDEPFTGQRLISARDFNLNDLLVNDTLKTIHSVYLVIVDFVIYIGVMTLCYNTLVSVFRGSPDSITVAPSEISEDERAFNQVLYSKKVFGIKQTMAQNAYNRRKKK